MLRAVIVDDEIPVLHLLNMVLRQTGQVDVSAAFADPQEALERMSEIKPDVVFLDIEMPEMNGLELAGRLVEQNDDCMVVFVTGYNQYALEAFRVHALDYLLKPVTPAKIEACIARLTRLRRASHEAHRGDGAPTKICCFGDFTVFGKHGAVKWATRKVEELLAYLIVHRDADIESWQLGESLWPEEEPGKVKANLHTALYRLRKTIQEAGLPIRILSEKGGKGTYCCRLGALSCDLAEFERAAVQYRTVHPGNVDEWENVYALYKDDLFSGKHYSWCESKKERLRRQFVRMTKHMAAYYCEAGLYDNAADKLLETAAKAPYDEEIHRSLLTVLGARNNRGVLMQCHRDFERKLREELGVEPQAETRRLFDELLGEQQTEH